MSDGVLVIGGGMAGAIAALKAAQSGPVTLVRRSLGATALSSGAIDVAPDPVAPGGALKEHLLSPEEGARQLAKVRPSHPYAVLKDALVRLGESLWFAHSALTDLVDAPFAVNALLPTPLGTVKPAAMAQRQIAKADVLRLPEDVAVIQLEVNPSVDAQLVARGLEHAARVLGRTLRAQVVSCRFFDRVEDALRGPVELGERLDEPGAVEALADELRRKLPKDVKAILFPPVLGRRSLDVAERLGHKLGLVCAELLSTAPSLPGIRLQEALDVALTRANVSIVEGEAHLVSGAPPTFTVEGRTLQPKAVVLATGKFIGGGIVRARRFQEPLFGLPVFSGGRTLGAEYIGELLSEDVAADQAAFRAGVQIDASLRPLGLGGQPAFDWLFAAGAVIAGCDAAADKSGLGVAIFTGYLAGEKAAQAASSARSAA